MSSDVNFNNAKNQPPAVPSSMLSSEGLTSGEMAILQAKLKKLFALDMADFQTTKQYILCCELYYEQSKHKSTECNLPTHSNWSFYKGKK